jgi:protease I
MAENTLNGLRVAILASDGFEQIELVAPRSALENAGAKTTLIAPRSGSIYGMQHHNEADDFAVDLELADAEPGDFDAVLLPGGALHADTLCVEEAAQEFVREIEGRGLPIAVICHGPWLLVSAKLTQGRTLTSYHTIQDDLQNAGATWMDKEVQRDRHWVSSRQPCDIPAFPREMIALFGELCGGRKARSRAAS